MWKANYHIEYLFRSLSSKSLHTPFYDQKSQKNVILLAMHYSESNKLESDTNRINEFVRNGWNVCSVDLSGFENTHGHISANFTTLRGIKSIIKATQYEQPNIIILDYFWLQQNYYEERYGEDWPEKCRLFFDKYSNLQCVFLPIDNPKTRQSSMVQQMERMHGDIQYFTVDVDSHLNPLVKFTMQSNDICDMFRREGRTHESQKFRISGFCVVHRSCTPKEQILSFLLGN